MTPQGRYDVVIIGAGLAGSLIAYQATRRGRRVALIEAGERFSERGRSEFVRHHDIVGGLSWPYLHAGRDGYTDQSLDSVGVRYALDSHRVKGVGGSTLHWGGRISRLLPTDFRTQSLYGSGVDWPIGYDALEPYYSSADWELGVSGTHAPSLPARSADYPNPGFPPSIDDEVWVPVAERLGIELYSSAFAVNSRGFRGRPECQGFMSCDVCPSGARYSAEWHIGEAERSGLCDLFTRSVARRIELDGGGAFKAVHVSTLDGAELEIEAAQCVVAAHAIESARLLLLSRIGNHSDQVGRNFMEHVYIEAGGFLDGRRFYPRRRFEVLESLGYYGGAERRERGGIKLEFTFEYDPLAEMEPRQIWGAALAAHDRQRFGHWLGIAAQTEQQPNPHSRITLDPLQKDMFGDPVPRLNLAFTPFDLRTQARARAIMAQLLEEVGARELEQAPLSSNSFGAHHMGTCRMSSDPDLGVVDADCRVHGSPNLYLAGASVFATGGALQPSLTAAALALRAADHLLAA